MAVDLLNYERYIVAFSGGKDSTAVFLHLLEQGVDMTKVELWHHLVDGRADPGKSAQLFDWPVTEAYCKAFAAAFDVPIYFSWLDGGFRREMQRYKSRKAKTTFEMPSGQTGVCGGNGKPGTRLRFPQISPDLSVRWCSSYLKIDVMAAALRNQHQFQGRRTLVLTGERGEESAARAKYKEFEPHRADSRNGRKPRHIDHWRPIISWSEKKVWEIMERHRVRAHPAYYAGFGRCSCAFCIFGNGNQFATAAKLLPSQAQDLIDLEAGFEMTMKRNQALPELIKSGTPYSASDGDHGAADDRYGKSIIVPHTEPWTLPAGAYGESAGPA